MSNKTKSLVFGYVRSNYLPYVPEVIVKKCLLFFDPEVIMKFKGKDLQKFLKSQFRHSFEKEIKFNQDFTIIFKIYPGGYFDQNKGFVGLHLEGITSNNVEYYAICFEILCVETQTMISSSYKMQNNDRHDGTYPSDCHLALSQCKQQTQLTFKFIIHSLEIKYKTNEDDDNPLFYPSLKAKMLKQETMLKWNVDMNKFKNCAERQTFSSEIVNNWNFLCSPNGYMIEQIRNGLILGFRLMSWPLNVSKMVIMLDNKVIINSEIMDDAKWHQEIALDDYDDNRLLGEICQDNTFRLEQTKDMVFDLTIIIKELYDMNDNLIPNKKWKDHNVEISKNE